MTTELRRSTDPEGEDFRLKRIWSQWKPIFLFAGAVGMGVGTFYVTIRKGIQDGENGPKNASVVQRFVEVDKKVSDLQSSVFVLTTDSEETKNVLREMRDTVREMRKSINNMARAVAIEDAAIDRHGEMLMKFEDLDKKVSKRR